MCISQLPPNEIGLLNWMTLYQLHKVYISCKAADYGSRVDHEYIYQE